MKKTDYSNNFLSRALNNLKNKYFLFFAITTITLASIFLFSQNNFLDTNFKLDNIKNIEKYTNFHTQNYITDDNDWLNPDFTSFYQNTLKPTILEKILIKIRISRKPFFSIKNFEKLLEKTTKERVQKKLISPFNETITLKKDNRCIVFGNLNGALHSFKRDLLELKKQKIINNNLEIVSPNTYFVFLGDVISKSPYCLELLNIIIALIDKNPQKIFYLRGRYEKDSNWRNFSMRRAIQIIFPAYASEQNKDSLQNKIDAFLSTLPDSLIINIYGHKSKNNGLIMLSNEEVPEIIENNSELFTNKIKFMLLGEKKHDIIKELSGLEFFGYECGVAKWSLLSCPTTIYKKFSSFYNDAFVELIIGQSAEKSLLQLYNRDTRTQDIDYKKIIYDPIFGHTIKTKADVAEESVFNIGSTMGITGVISAFAQEYKAGLETAIYFNNEIGDNLIKPVIFNDGYTPNIARINVEKLLNQYSIKNIISPMGTPTLAFYLDKVKAGEVYVFFPYTGAIKFRDKELKNILHFRPSYSDEARSIINYLVKDAGITNFAIFYQNDSFGMPIAQTAHDELKKLGITKWLDLPHLSTQTNFKELIEKIKLTGPEAIALFSTTFATQEFIEQLGPDFFSERILFGVSFIFSDPFCKFLDNRGIEYLLTSIVPDPITSTLRIAKEFREHLAKRGIKANSNAFEGYISASLIIDAINKINPPITEDKIMKYFENMKDYKLKGLNLTFNPETRDLSQPTWIRNMENEWITYKYQN